jgi:peptide/nickel transport system permease protein
MLKTKKSNPLIRYFLSRIETKVGMGIIAFFVGVALVSFVYLPYNPIASTGQDYSPPSLQHLFGTTSIGQDVFSQWMYGARATLFVGFLAALMTTAIGVAVGISAGFISLLEEPLMRLVDVVLTLPTLPLLIVIAAFVRPSLLLVAGLISVLAWAGTARVIRSATLSLRRLPYVEVAMLSGVPKRVLMFRDIIRHLLPLILAYSMFAVIGAILTEASLDFIGVGPVTDYSWGAMISLAQSNNALFAGAWWWFVPPGLSIALISTAFALVAYSLEDTYRRANA